MKETARGSMGTTAVRILCAMATAAFLGPMRASSSPFDLRGVSVTGEAGSDDLARAGAGWLSLIQRRHGGARALDRHRAALLRGLPGPAPGRQRLLRHG